MLAIVSLPILAIFLASAVSASGELLRLLALNELLSKSDSYDIIWDGPSRGDRLFFTASKNPPSAISNLNANNVDFLIYQRNDIRDYSRFSYSSSRYSPYSYYNSYNRYPNYGFPYRSSFGDTRYFRDNSERLIIDNRYSYPRQDYNMRYWWGY